LALCNGEVDGLFIYSESHHASSHHELVELQIIISANIDSHFILKVSSNSPQNGRFSVIREIVVVVLAVQKAECSTSIEVSESSIRIVAELFTNSQNLQ